MMRQFPKTALAVAAARGRLTGSVLYPGLCTDHWAKTLSGDEGALVFDAWEKVFPDLELWLGLRTAWFDRNLMHYLSKKNHPQVVLLGSGLDTRAERFRNPIVRFFEVDRDDTVNWKQELLKTLPGYPEDSATFVSYDFQSSDSLLDRLMASGFVPELPTLYVMEGVSMYLREEDIRRLFTEIAARSNPHSFLFFDHIGKHLVDKEHSSDPSVKGQYDFLASLGAGEQFSWGTDDALPLCYETGFKYIRQSTFDSLCLAFTQTYSKDRLFKYQHVVSAGTIFC